MPAVMVCWQVAEVMSARLANPTSVDPLSGGVIDHCVRVLDGLPIYTEPNDTFVSLVYTPAYYYIVAGAMRLLGENVFAAQLTSILLTLLAAGLMAWTVWRTTRSVWPALLTLPIVACGYSVAEFFYDYPRVDPAVTFMTAGAVWAALGPRRTLSAVVTGLFLTLAFWCKQTIGVFIALFLLQMLIVEWRWAMVAGAVSAVTGGLSVAWANGATDGWFWTFVYVVPSKHSLTESERFAYLTRDWFGTDLLHPSPLLIPMLVILAGAVILAVHWRRTDADPKIRTLLGALVAIIGYTLVSRMNEGASTKVFMPFCILLGAIVPVCVWRLVQAISRPARRWIVHWTLAALMFAMMGMNRFDKAEALMDDHALALWDEVEDTIRHYSRKGQVWVPWGHITTRMEGQSMRPNQMALMDYLGRQFGDKTNQPFPLSLRRALARQEFSAVLYFNREGNTFKDLPFLKQSYRVAKLMEVKFNGMERNRTRIAVAVPNGRASERRSGE